TSLNLFRSACAATAASLIITTVALADSNPTLTDAQQQQLANAQVRTANAQAEQAELAAQKAARDLLPSSGISSDATTKKGPRLVEGSLLSAAAMQEAPRCIATRLRRAGSSSTAPPHCPSYEALSLPADAALHVYVYSGDTPVDVIAGHAYQQRLGFVTENLD